MSSTSLSPDLIKYLNISDYRFIRRGGQKTVYAVKIGTIEYALKLIHVVDERFKREVEIVQKFKDNNGIPTIIEIDRFNNETLILEEYIPGNDLSDSIENFKGDEKKVKSLIFKIGEILQPIWEANYVHRDLKPHNIRLMPNGNVIVLDFGIARALDENSITTAGQPLSFLFASPEQYAGKKSLISYKTDFFCLGIIAYYLFKQEFPFGRNSQEIEKTFTKPITNISTGSDVIDNFCCAVLKSNPSERPRKISTFFNLLKQ